MSRWARVSLVSEMNVPILLSVMIVVTKDSVSVHERGIPICVQVFPS